MLNSHTVIWWVDPHGFLSPVAHAAIANLNNELFVSAATIWEIGIKVGSGKLTLSRPYRDWMNQAIADWRATTFPVSVEYTQVQIDLPQHHGDPFDRLLVARPLAEQIAIISNDAIFGQRGLLTLVSACPFSPGSYCQNHAVSP